MNTNRCGNFLLLLLCATVLAGCERKTAAPSAPAPETVSGMTRDQTSYTFLKWNEGLAIMLVDHCDVHHMSGSGGSGKSDRRRGDAHWRDRDADEWKVGYEWQLETDDGQTAVLAINNVEYDLSKGAVFRIDTGGDEAVVTQMENDLSKIQPDKDSTDHFVASTPEFQKSRERVNVK